MSKPKHGQRDFTIRLDAATYARLEAFVKKSPSLRSKSPAIQLILNEFFDDDPTTSRNWRYERLLDHIRAELETLSKKSTF